MAVAGPGTELRVVVTSWPRGEPMAFVTGWISSATLCRAMRASATERERDLRRVSLRLSCRPAAPLSE